MNPQQNKPVEKKKLARLSGSGSKSNEGKPAGPTDDSGNSSTEEENKGTRGLTTGPTTSILRQALQGLPIKTEEPKGDDEKVTSTSDSFNTQGKGVVPSPTRKNIPAAFALPLNPTEQIDLASGNQSTIENPSELAELPSPRNTGARPRVSPKRKPGSCANQEIVSPSKILRRDLNQEISPSSNEFCSTASIELGNTSSETASTMATVISSMGRLWNGLLELPDPLVKIDDDLLNGYDEAQNDLISMSEIISVNYNKEYDFSIPSSSDVKETIIWSPSIYYVGDGGTTFTLDELES
ncbi:uncharacterized protein LOC123688581 isoform X2 [Harmonia axyridis]|uniref:uncharacterized protein LOC123688581 isoform X2 n=1 Tax=Harmonia axyridis TaxID=115357 RepID=UPI001E279470|nr:uncharacterized protein LOC123688581 isoform X2 [Harmonia axyridis]